MEAIFKVVHVGNLNKEYLLSSTGQPYVLEKKQVLLRRGGDTLLAVIYDTLARDFNCEPEDYIYARVSLKADFYKNQDGDERTFNTARIYKFEKL